MVRQDVSGRSVQDSCIQCIENILICMFIKKMPPKGAKIIFYVNLSLHKTCLQYRNNFVHIAEKNRKNRSFSGKIGINRNRSEKNRKKIGKNKNLTP